MLTCVSEIPITLYWIVKRLLRLCFLQMLHARWISLDSRGKWPRIAMVIYERVETGSSSCYWNWQQFHTGNKQQVAEVCVCSRCTPSAPKCTLKSFLWEQRNWKWTLNWYAVVFRGCPTLKALSNESMAIIRTSLVPNWGLSREHNFVRNLYLMVILRAKCP